MLGLGLSKQPRALSLYIALLLILQAIADSVKAYDKSVAFYKKTTEKMVSDRKKHITSIDFSASCACSMCDHCPCCDVEYKFRDEATHQWYSISGTYIECSLRVFIGSHEAKYFRIDCVRSGGMMTEVMLTHNCVVMD